MNHRERLAAERKQDAAEAKALKEQKRAVFDAALKRMHENGDNDVEIARALGCNPDTVMRARKRLGLEANRG